MNVRELREALEGMPDHYEVEVETRFEDERGKVTHDRNVALEVVNVGSDYLGWEGCRVVIR